MVDARRRDGARLSAPVTRDSGTATPRCYLCEERFEPGEYTEHYNDRHLPRLVIPTGTPAGGGASIGQLLAYSADAPALMADLLVLLHHAAAQVESSRAEIQSDGSVGATLVALDDSIALLVLARQTLADAVVAAGPRLLEDGEGG